MVRSTACFLLQLVLVQQIVAQEKRSFRMSLMPGYQFQCVNTTCPPYSIVAVSGIRKCQMTCLAYLQCQAASFHQPTSYCRLFSNMLYQSGNIFADPTTVSMLVKTETRDPPEPTTTSTSTTSSSTSSTSSTTSQTTTTRPTSMSPIPPAPTNLVAYRGNNGQTYVFNVTGSCSGSLWGTTIYTDDSSLTMAAVHAGYAQCGVMTTITVRILAGQSTYTGSTQYGITSSSYGAWSGSYSIISSSG